MRRQQFQPSGGINLHLYPSTIEFESRLMRMTGSLAASDLFARIDIVGIGGPELPAREDLDGRRRIIRLPFATSAARRRAFGRIGSLLEWNLRIIAEYRQLDIRMVNPHVVWALPAAAWFKSRRQSSLVYDTHELETRTANSRGLRRVLSEFIEQRYIGACDAINVVSEGIADWYRGRYGLTNVHTIKNYPLRRADVPETRAFRDRFSIPDQDLVFCYQGRLSRRSEIETLLRIFTRLPQDRHLVFMGFGPLVERVQAVARTLPNIHFMPGVPFHEVPSFTGSADVALVLFKDTCLSYRHVLPNKLLESLQAGVPVIASDLPDMAAEIGPDDAGWVVGDSDEDLSNLIANIDHVQIAQKRRGALAWSARNEWEQEADRMIEAYRRILSR